MLDVIVLIAMAVTAVAFAAGMTAQAGLPLIPVVIATAALFLVMAASYTSLGRGGRSRASSGGGGDRLDELEEALEIIDNDLQRIDRIEDDVSRLDHLSDRVERLDQALSQGAPGDGPVGRPRGDELAAEFESVHAKIEGLRADVEAETRSQRERIANDLGLLEGLIKRLSSDLSGAGAGAAAAAAAPLAAAEPSSTLETRASPPPPPIQMDDIEDEPISVAQDETPDVMEEEVAVELVSSEAAPAEELASGEFTDSPADEITPEVSDAGLSDELFAGGAADTGADELVASEADAGPPEISAGDEIDEDEMCRSVREAVEGGRIDLYLQPVVTLPERKVRYYEALTRIRSEQDDLVLPRAYIPVAKRAGMMPLIDNVLLVKSVQLLRRLGPDSKIRGLFCNISMHSLLDPDFFPELVEFLEENSSLSESLIFEVSQPEIVGLTQSELGCLDTLGELGYSFSVDHVADFDVDFAALSDRYFRYVKLDAGEFLRGLEGSEQSAADLKRQLDGLGIQPVIEKVEMENDVAELLDYGVELAQGFLFGEPKPVGPELYREIEEVDAA